MKNKTKLELNFVKILLHGFSVFVDNFLEPWTKLAQPLADCFSVQRVPHFGNSGLQGVQTLGHAPLVDLLLHPRPKSIIARIDVGGVAWPIFFGNEGRVF